MNCLRKFLFLALMSGASLSIGQSFADFFILPTSQNPGGGCGNASVEFALIDSFQTFGINGTYYIEEVGGNMPTDTLHFVSNGFSPIVAYTFPFDGVFQVTLYTYNPNGVFIDSSSQVYTVVSQGQALNPQFSVSQSASSSCDSVELTFDITSINSQSYSYEYYILYDWNSIVSFVQGSSSMPNPTVTVPADMGGVDVLLFVHDGVCQDSTSLTVFIDSSLASGSSVQASFASSLSLLGCDSIQVDLNNTSSGGSVYSWIVYDQFQNIVHSSTTENTSFTYDVNGVNTANMLYIYYEVSDASGCSSYAYETLLLDSLGAFLYAFLENTFPVSCTGNGADGGAGVFAYGGTLPYSYSLNGGPMMAVTSSYFVIDSLPAGSYSVDVMDANGCNVIVDFTVSAADSVLIYASEYFDACGNDSSGIFLQSSGLHPFTYQWSTGDTTSYVWGPAPGLISVTVTDALGCSASYSTIVPDSNDCVELFGSVFLDDNANCIQDGNDAGLANIPILLTSTTSGNTYWAYTDAAGSYSIRVPEDNYDVETTWQYNSYYSPTCGASFLSNISLSIVSGASQLDFGYQIDSSTVQDLSVSVTAFSTATPGFPYYNYIQYCNDGLLPMSGTVELTYDSQLEWAPSGNTAAGYYYNTYPLPTSSNTASQLLTWDFVNLAPYQCRTIYVDFNTPINMGLMPGMPVVQNVNITPVAGDATPSNNIASLNDSITSSWDPNDKAVYPAGQMSTDEKDHHYTIRFQNEGNGPAYRVVIRDVIDANLDLQTLRNVSASHDFVISQEVPGELAFIFDNINLVPQSVSEELSQGFVSFTLSQVDDVSENTIISNTADIFFDFNPAITTNTVENLIKNEVTSISGLVSTLAIYPNPTSGLIHVESSNPVSNFVLTDMSGRRVWSMSNEVNSFTTDLSHIAPGMYMIQWFESGQQMHSRIQIH